MSETLALQSFERLNSFFQEKLKDERLYTSENFSFLKLFQHALSYEQSGAHARIIKNYLHWPLWAQVGLLRLRARVRTSFVAPPLTELVGIDPARIVADANGQWHSIYMERIASLFPPHTVTLLNRKKEQRLNNRISLDQIPRNYGVPDQVELNMLREVHEVVRKTLQSDHWSEIQKRHILSALHIFFDDFRFYYRLFRKQPAKAVMFISHYHNEGLLAALKALSIRSVELQHGLIAGGDLYYQYPDIFRKAVQNAFFPDCICVYGSYWKEILLRGCEFKDSQIVIAGDYLWHAADVKKLSTKENLVLICAQKNFHNEYIQYAKSLLPFMEKHPDWKWVIKMHPLENRKQDYSALASEGFIIIDQEESLDALLGKSKIHISIYSTTFYDALGNEVVNFSLQNYGTASDYAKQMVEEGAALPIQIGEDPIDKLLCGPIADLRLKRDEVYGFFDESSIRVAIMATNF